ncbi:MAG: hypothetical protein ACRBBW_19875 [Cellvibrionaceae bacterium]
MKQVTYEKGMHLLSTLAITNHIDAGATDFYEGDHPMLGGITLIVADGTCVLIKK